MSYTVYISKFDPVAPSPGGLAKLNRVLFYLKH